jgi:hypothetical protein
MINIFLLILHSLYTYLAIVCYKSLTQKRKNAKYDQKVTHFEFTF